MSKEKFISTLVYLSRGSDLLHFFLKKSFQLRLCNCGNEEYVKMSQMQGLSVRQIKLSPALCSKHTWCVHTLITPPDTHIHSHTDRGAQSSYSQLSTTPTQGNKIKSCITYSRVQQSRPLQMCLKGDRREESERKGEVEAWHEG